MSDHFVITGEYTGDEYLVTVNRVDGKYLLTVYGPGCWSKSRFEGLAYYPGSGHQCRGKWLRRQDYLARAHVRGLERARRREDQRYARTARLVERRNRPAPPNVGRYCTSFNDVAQISSKSADEIVDNDEDD